MKGSMQAIRRLAGASLAHQLIIDVFRGTGAAYSSRTGSSFRAVGREPAQVSP